MKQQTTNFSLKDQLFNKEKVEYISGLIHESYPDFLEEDFITEVLEDFPNLELTQRITHITTVLRKYLPENFTESVTILLNSLPTVEENGSLDNNFGDFIFSPFLEYVATYGLENKTELYFCLDALEKMTVNFSAEFSIRHFFNTFEEETFSKMLEWSKSKNYHVRRLASEGSRAKLPWGKKINLDYKKTIQILDNLYTDESRFVTRSVANHLNDISKIDADLVVETLKRWKNEVENPVGNECIRSLQNTDINYIISHATRGLVKAGDTGALELLGYSSNPKIEITDFNIKNETVKIGESLVFSFNVECTKKENLIIDYKIYFQNKVGVLKPKVFKIKKINGLLTEGFSPLKITKQHKLKLMTTKALYPGEHQVEIMINGKSFGKKGFELIV